jgi:DNA polymerase-3 subunit epsilon
MIEKMSSSKGITKDEFIKECKENSLIVDDGEFDLALAYINNAGIDTIEKNSRIYSKTRFRTYKDEIFCIVDIETNGNSPQYDQIIELGAIKFRNGCIIDRFESFVYSDFVPDYIKRITNISQNDLVGAPKLKDILKEFKNFLGNSVFVAHNVRFDYNFISQSFQKFGFEEMLNRRLCTINLAKKTIESEKYGLSFLKEELGIDIDNHHRAYADALSALKIFEISLKNIPSKIKTTEDLIEFSNPPKRKRKKQAKSI